MSWSDLPSELVITIARNLTEFTDRLRFRSVCSHWRSSFHSHTLCLPPQLPWLVFPASTSSTHFYSFSEDRVYSNPPPNVSDNSNLFGSASGWFLSISGQDRLNTISLINPFTCAVIMLPFLYPCLLNGIIYTLVWDRSYSVVVVGFRRRRGMFYCRLGDAAWASIKFLHCTPRSITFCEDKFYILNSDTFDTIVLDGKTLERITVIRAPFVRFMYVCLVWAHLFVSSGELFLLGRSTGNGTYGSLPVYNVQRANLNDELVEWIAINNIGDHALFVDDLHCFSVKVEDNCLLKKNCIYSTKYTNNGGLSNSSWAHSIFIFDLGNNSAKRLGDALSKFPVAFSRAAVPSPSWVLPSLS